MKFDEDIKRMNICFQAKMQLQRLRDNVRKERARRDSFNNRCEVQTGDDASEIDICIKTPQTGGDAPQNDLFAPPEKIEGRYNEKIVSKLEKSKYEFSLFSIPFKEESPAQPRPWLVCVEDKVMALLDAGLIPCTTSGGVVVSDIVEAVKADNTDNYKITAETIRLILKRHGWKSAKAPRGDSADGKQLRVWYPPFNNFK